MGIMDASRLRSFLYPINFQIRQSLGDIFPGNNNCVKIFEKKQHHFCLFEISLSTG